MTTGRQILMKQSDEGFNVFVALVAVAGIATGRDGIGTFISMHYMSNQYLLGETDHICVWPESSVADFS